MSPVYGKIEGDICPLCKECLDIDGEFTTDEEIDCKGCGAILVISEIEAAYKLTMDVVCLPPEDDEEEE